MDETTTSDGQRVAVGQTWADNDRRSRGRTVRITEIGASRVSVEVVTDIGGKPPQKPRQTRILLKRLRPTSTGYRLLHDTVSART